MFFFGNKYGDQTLVNNMIPYLELTNYTTKNNRVQNLFEFETIESIISKT